MRVAGRLADERLDRGERIERVVQQPILFADIVGFTEMASRVTPIELIETLNKIFSTFDQLTEHFGLEKVKTVGDAYMVVAGLPVAPVIRAASSRSNPAPFSSPGATAPSMITSTSAVASN